MVRNIVSFLPPRKRAEISLVSSLFNVVSASLWSSQKVLFVQPQHITTDYYTFREETCRIDETKYSNFLIYLNKKTDLLRLPFMDRGEFENALIGILKRCSSLKMLYYVFASDYAQSGLIERLSLERLRAACPTLIGAFTYECNLFLKSPRALPLPGSEHIKFSYILNESVGVFRPGQIRNFIKFVTETDLSGLKSLAFEFVKEFADVLPVLVRNAKNLEALEIITTDIDSCVLTRSDFLALALLSKVRKFKISTRLALVPEEGLEILLNNYRKLEQFHVGQFICKPLFYALQANANLNYIGRLEVFTWFDQQELRISPNINGNLVFTKYKASSFRVENPGERVLFYAYDE